MSEQHYSDIAAFITDEYASDTRLYELTLHNADNSVEALGYSGLMVEAFAGVESLHDSSRHDIILLSTNAHINLHSLINKTASLQISLSDATRTTYTGIINQAALLGSEGGFARYRIRLVSWLWLLTQQRNSRVFQDQSIISIIDSVFSEYSQHASWTWSDDVALFMNDTRDRSYCVQYRETDYDFVRRLLTEEGLSFRIEEAQEDSGSPSLHRIVLFADSTQLSATPEDITSMNSLGGQGIRFHGGRSREEQDSIQMLTAKRQLNPASTSVLSFDYKAKKAIAATSYTHHQYGGKQTPMLESYDSTGIYTYANSSEASRYASLHQQSQEARNKTWQARSTVRSLRPGTRFNLTQSPIEAGETYTGDPLAPEYVVLNVQSIGINNLPKQATESLTEIFGDIPSLLQESLQQLSIISNNSDVLTNRFNAQQGKAENSTPQTNHLPSIEHAIKLGYANAFDAIRADIPWRPILQDDTGLRHNSKPTALGSQTAIVIGATGNDEAAQDNGNSELYCDRLGRIKIRFHWQGQGEHADSHNTCWVRVVQRNAGNGMGWQFLPRIGQEVQVQFMDNDIDRPVIIGALYNGQGDGGIKPSPAGDTSQTAKLDVYKNANDHQSSAQANLVGGNSPVWHGASNTSDGHNNEAAITGIRSKEFNGLGYNQLVLDDTDSQGRIQLKSTQHSSELNLGHLIHTADNYRGSFRGQGAELRTDAYGALRAGAGYLITSYSVNINARQRDYAADNIAGMAHLKHASQLAESFNQAALTHQTVQYSSHIGSHEANKSAIATSIKPQAPLKALLTAVSGMVSQQSLEQADNDAQNKNTQPKADSQPHATDPIISLVGKAGLNITAGQHLQMANEETTTLMSGEDSQFITGEQFRVHSGQAIGMLAGAVSAGQQNTGLQLITGKDNTHIQAQSDEIKIQAKKQIDIMSSNAHIDWAAAKSISLSTSGGANITIADGNITVQCPGMITIHASQKKFTGPATISHEMNTWPEAKFDQRYMVRHRNTGKPMQNALVEITRGDGTVLRVKSDNEGRLPIQKSTRPEKLTIKVLG